MNESTVVTVFRQLLRSAKWGVLALCIVNISAAFTGVSLGFGWVSGCTAVGLGAPGVVGLLMLNAIVWMG